MVYKLVIVVFSMNIISAIWAGENVLPNREFSMKDTNAEKNKLKITKEVLIPANDSGYCTLLSQYYPDSGNQHRIQRKEKSGESDFFSGTEERESFDNGKSWGEWRNVYKDTFAKVPGGEKINCPVLTRVVHPKYDHLVSLHMERLFVEDHKKAYAREGAGDFDGYFDHSYLDIRSGDGKLFASQLLKYEDGEEEFSLDKLANCRQNISYALGDITIMKNGDILFAMSIPMRKCCAMRGVDVQELFPSCPDMATGMLVVRGCWNKEKQRYDLRFSRPVVISDLLSSRGILEPTVAELANGRIVVVFRGSNVRHAEWHTRIEAGTPGVKWVTWSDDGGKYFTDPMPWHFDNGEFVSSPSALSQFVRSPKNGRLYWVGNVTPAAGIDGNEPRWPLQIAEVNERGFLIRDSLTVIDTRQPGESEKLQLSNFIVLHDRIDQHTELFLIRYGQNTLPGTWKNFWRGDSCSYRIDWPN